MTIGEQIKKYRKYNKLTQIQLAEKTSIGVASIQRYERNELKPNIETLTNIADALGVPVTKLLGIKKDGTPYSSPGLYVCGTDGESIEDMLGDFKTYKEEYTEMADKYSIKFINDLVIEKPYDKKISDIKKKIDNGESLSNKDKKIIDDNAARKKIEKDFELTEDISVMDYEKESYKLFKELLTSLGYDNETARPYLFKKIKAQIELEVNMQKE
ncbi:MAG: helix-turn-helix domain-containing protein [Clostridium beijerinckii]|nr:helix-turn-helix domain-containing protein [Clostridium beijerinckii]MCI1580460.1 helix-turn-helix domain-containing protein [Clostridium beijerinckii]MCI1584934.1 helix-turn-helix domain-containing protein [Clostridium beijerinckii]MCI1623733.1 helix-turn-helix domain-containing protein [Clostridium beijerinckii]